jgi:hypothetical protein
VNDRDADAITFAELESFLGLSDDGLRDDGDLGAYLDAAAVLAAFDPLVVRPARPPDDPDAVSVIDSLLPRCESITQGPARGLWTLSLPDRRARLRGMGGTAGMVESLRANPDRPDLPVQCMFEQVLEGRPVEPAALSRTDLAALITLHDWLDGVLDVLPPKPEILRAIARDDVTAPMRRLVAEGFLGRDEELQWLRRHLLGHGPSAPPPMFVHGPGGIGKSTLLARVLLNTAGDGTPIAYLDIDRPTIRPDQAATVLVAMLTQLATQLDVPPTEMESLLKEFAHLLRRQEKDRAFETNLETLEGMVRRLLPYTLGDRRMLVVIDTFEEAQYLGGEVVWLLLSFLSELLETLPGLRIVIGGRALPDEYHQLFPATWDPIDLGVLDQASARELLSTAAPAGLGVDELDDVIAVVSRNPMCLRLAARLLRDEGVDRLRETRSDFLTHLRSEKIQALLYGRILRHLHSDTARAVAFPGLVVRRITPGVIREVLAGPCRLDLAGTNAEQVFGELAAEVALVRMEPDGSLRHRTDVRRSMLEDLTDQVPAEKVTAIDEAAVAFYASRDDPVSRAEEIYHRLRLRQSPDILDRRWLPAAADHLRGAAEELPPAQRLWLARHLGITLDDTVRRAAGQEEWEDQAARRADRYLQAGHGEEALGTLRERPARSPRSPLFALEAEALRFLRRPDEALATARAGVESALRAGAVDMALDLLLKMAVIEEGRGDLAAAARLADEAADVARHSAGEMLRLRSTITGLRLSRRLGREVPLPGLTAAVRRDLRGRPVLLREAAAELGADDPELAAAAVEVLGFEMSTAEQAVALARAVLALTDTVPDLDPAFTTVARAVGPPVNFTDPAYIEEVLSRFLGAREVRRTASALGRTAPGHRPLPEFRDYFRAGVDSSLGR